MDNQLSSKLQLNRGIIIRTAVIFIVAYCLSLAIWLFLPIQNNYGLIITKLASYLISIVKGVDIVEIVRNADIVTVDLVATKFGTSQGLRASIDIPTGNYAFNVPLTLAIMASFYPHIKSKWLYVEALALLIFVHFLFVFSLEGQKITAALNEQGFESSGAATIIFWEFLWGFVDNMVVRFEPFLIGAYLYLLRNRVRVRKTTPEKTEKTQRAATRQTPRKRKSKKRR